MAAKSKALIEMEARVKELEAKISEQDEMKKLSEKEQALEKQLLVQDKEDAQKEVVDLKQSVKLSKEAEVRLLDELENMEQPVVVDGKVQAAGCVIFTGNEYTEDLKRRGIKVVSRFDIETLRTFINSDWSPSMVMDKFGLSEAQLQSYVWKLSEMELRGDSPIKLNFKRDTFGREG